MSNVKNIIDTLKNQGANPDLSQINLIEKLCKMNISKKFSFKKVFSFFSNNQSKIISFLQK